MSIWDELSPRETLLHVMACQHCGTKFIPGRRTQLYCSSECRVAYWKKHKQLIEIELDSTDTVISATLNHVNINPISVRIDYQDIPNGKLAICDECSTQYNQVRSHQRFCSSKCRYTNWIKLNP